MRIYGLDVHRTFAEVALLDERGVRSVGRINLTAEALHAFGRQLTKDDDVVLEATCNTHAIARLLRAYVRRVVVSNPLQTRAIAEAKVKTDKIDATVLARLHASGFLPEVWSPDELTEQLRRQVARHATIVQHRTRLKNRIHAILHRNLCPRCPAADLFGRKGRSWLAAQVLPADERTTVESVLRELDHVGEDLAMIDRDLAQTALTEPSAQRLMTIPGVDVAVALGLVAAIGPITRFRSPQKLVSYLGLNPRVRQSGLQPAHHGRITKQGRAHARGMLVEAAWVAAKTPGPLRAFFLRIRARRGEQIAAVATARKLAVLVWHLLTAQQNYAWGRPLLAAQKRRALELRAGLPARRGQRGATHGYNLKERREQEREIGAQAERAYQTLVARWRPQRPRRGTASTEIRPSKERQNAAPRFGGYRRMGSRTIVDSGANTDRGFFDACSEIQHRGKGNGTRVPPERRATDAPKRYLRGGACSLMLHASVGVTRAHVHTIATRGHPPLDTFIRRMTRRWRSGKRRCAMHASKSSRKHCTTAGSSRS